MVLEPVVGDHQERDREGDELRADRIEQRSEARPRCRRIVDVQGRHQQRQRERVGRVDEADRTVELRVFALEHSPRIKQRVPPPRRGECKQRAGVDSGLGGC